MGEKGFTCGGYLGWVWKYGVRVTCWMDRGDVAVMTLGVDERIFERDAEGIIVDEDGLLVGVSHLPRMECYITGRFPVPRTLPSGPSPMFDGVARRERDFGIGSGVWV